MSARNYDRLYVTPVLPYRVGSLEIDEEALRRFLRYFLQPKFVTAGGAIIINPVAGEIFFLSREEKRRVVQIAVEECGGKVPVFAGAIDWTTRDTVEIAREAKEAGADGIFIVPPSGPTDISLGWDCVRHPEIWMDMVREIDQEVGLPMIAHPTAPAGPGTAGGLALEPTLRMCRDFPNIVGWKMTYSYDNYLKVAWGLRSLEHHVGVLGAAAGFFHEYLANDLFDGTASGGWNYAMEPMVDHIQAWRSGEIAQAKGIWAPLKRLHGYVMEDKTHHHLRYKLATWLRGLIPSPYMRPPMPRPGREETFRLRDLLREAGLHVIGDAEIEDGLNSPPKELQRMAS
ncbi:MAG: dihydrodipicolinate synthase family protein [Deltaproteobacteria bacterium]|nr:dihydrodipicolinate synthase family protein [Deltaproteobacteria bacterium]MBI3077552.1 dihydrodipicolinate synthase family protein [Deltaproteobacteria bacterium]